MPGIGEGDCAVRLNPQNQASRKSAVAAVGYAVVEACEKFPRRCLGLCKHVQRAHQETHHHRRCHPLAAHVSNRDERSAACQGQDLKEVSAHLSVGFIDRSDRKPRHRWNLFRNQHLLHRSARGQFRGQPLFLRAIAHQVPYQDGECSCPQERNSHGGVLPLPPANRRVIPQPRHVLECGGDSETNDEMDSEGRRNQPIAQVVSLKALNNQHSEYDFRTQRRQVVRKLHAGDPRHNGCEEIDRPKQPCPATIWHLHRFTRRLHQQGNCERS